MGDSLLLAWLWGTLPPASAREGDSNEDTPDGLNVAIFKPILGFPAPSHQQQKLNVI